jgi:NAD(P)-dependent dehydrogenase (short-subunit alcohol dehydrogenase family)
MKQAQLAGKVALVTGATSGLGRRFAHVLAEAGAAVALAARRVERLQAEVAAIEGAGGKAFALPLDVSDVQAIGPAMDKAQEALGPLNILVNNAGVNIEASALEMSVEDWDAVYAVNVRAPFLCSREAARRMIDSGVAARGEGRIVNIASITAFKVFPGLPAYCSSKAAVVQLTKSLARDWARRGISVNAICPGYVSTELNDEFLSGEHGQRMIAGFPRRRLMQEADLDAALLLLSGPAASAITGTAITVDDGQSL